MPLEKFAFIIKEVRFLLAKSTSSSISSSENRLSRLRPEAPKAKLFGDYRCLSPRKIHHNIGISSKASRKSEKQGHLAFFL